MALQPFARRLRLAVPQSAALCQQPLGRGAVSSSPSAHRGLSAGSASGETRHDIGVGPGAAGLSVADWSRKKNSNKGPPVSARFRGTWSRDADVSAAISASRVPRVPGFMPAVILRNVFTEEECRGLIEAVPSGGPGYLGSEEVNQLYNDRVVKYRFLTHDEALADRMLARCKAYLPERLDGGRLWRVNPGFRFVHHNSGGHQAGHIDGREPVEPEHSEHAGGYVQSRLSLQIYLSGDFTGGHFVILEPDADSETGFKPKYVHKPQPGDAVVFYQERLLPPSQQVYELFHEAQDVLAGDKYACRTMVDYVFPDPETAQMSNLKDDMLAE